MEDLYYGPPDKDHYCALQYTKGGVLRPDLRCPNHISFYVKVPDGRSDDWRKAWASCAEHLATLIWQMQVAHGPGDSLYGGEYQLRAEELLCAARPARAGRHDGAARWDAPSTGRATRAATCGRGGCDGRSRPDQGAA